MQQPPSSAPSPADEPLVAVRNVSVRYPVGRAGFWGGERLLVQAVEDVTLSIDRGRTLGLVGESGSGKSTLGRAILHMAPLSSGSIVFDGEDITATRGETLRQLRRRMQIVFQDPYASLNPRMTVLETVAEPLVVHGLARSPAQTRDRVASLLTTVGLSADALPRYPHSFSGGQRQRIGIARALALEPDFIVADEPVSALDVSIRAQVVNLLQSLQKELGLTFLFIAHDLAVVRHISHRIAIMYAGRVVEIGDSDDICLRPQHPYTEALLAAVLQPDPVAERRRAHIAYEGEVPSPLNPPPGCAFAPRCPLASDRCRSELPALAARAEQRRMLACHQR